MQGFSATGFVSDRWGHVSRALTVIVVVGLCMASVMTSVAADEPAEADAPVRGDTPVPDDLDEAASGLHERRTEPFDASRSSSQLAQVEVAVQTYEAPCGGAVRGDLQRLLYLDSGAGIGWQWETCDGGHFTGHEEEILIFAIDGSLSTQTFTDDYVIVQFMDGYFALYDTLGRDQVDQWWLLDSGFGEVQRSAAGEVTGGSFVADVATSGFPVDYEFVVATYDQHDEGDAIPSPGHPAPRFPTECTTIDYLGAQVVVEPDDVDAITTRLVDAGYQVRSVAEHAGVITIAGVEARDLDSLRTIDGVTDAELNRTFERERAEASEAPVQTAGASDLPWSVLQLGLPDAWGTIPGHAANIAVIDTGIDPSMSALSGRVGAGIDIVANEPIPVGQNSAMSYHGTGVAAMVAATGDSDVYGANPQATVTPVLSSTHDLCVRSDWNVAAIDAATGMDEVDIINLSYGGPEPSVAEEAAVERAVAAGKIVIAASGNDGALFFDTPNYPAAYDDVIAVGASNQQNALATFSQQAAAEILAPGESVTTYGPTGRVAPQDGTSLSAPYVAGALSLWLAENPDASNQDARDALQDAAEPLDEYGAGAGILNVGRLVEPADDSPNDHPFADVAGTTHEDAILAVANADITTGYADGTFGPNDNLTRGQMASFLTRALDL